MLKETVFPNPAIKSVLADKGYDSNAIRSSLEVAGKEAVIPPRANRIDLILYDKLKYKNRNKTERLFGKIKEFRGIATRYDKLARRFLAGINSVLIALFARNYLKIIVNTA
jgi:transposase